MRGAAGMPARIGEGMSVTRNLGKCVLTVLLLVGAACGSPTGPDNAAAPTAAPAASMPTPGHVLRVALVATRLAVGTYRLPIGVSDRNTPVTDAAVHLRGRCRDGRAEAGGRPDARGGLSGRNDR
jgi:hypothetical protein